MNVSLSADMGIDLGTATVLVFLRNRGIVLNEPSVVAIEQGSNKVLAVGEGAQQMLGRTPGNIVATRPLKEGVIADFDVTEVMLKHFIYKVSNRRMFFRPRVVVCVPTGTTAVEQKAVLEAVNRTGARQTFLIEEPRAAALGAGLEVFDPSGHMVVDIGGGTTDVAVLSLGEIVVSESIKIGGDKFDDAILRYIKKEFNLLIGERTAEALKVKVGSACPQGEVSMSIRGRDLVTGLPRSLEITTSHLSEAFEEPLEHIITCIKQVLEKTPPELAGDIINRGIVLTGGGALLHGLDDLISQETQVPAYIAEEPVGCVARGTGKVLERLDQMIPSLITKRKVASLF